MSEGDRAIPRRAYPLIVFDWDGTAVVDRREDATELLDRLLTLLNRGIACVIVTGTNIANIAGQLDFQGKAVPRGRLYAATNRGSEVYAFAPDGTVQRIVLRRATASENAALDRIATRLAEALEQRTGLPIAVVFDRLNRRKIDLIPLPDWRDPPKARIGELLSAVNARFEAAGLPGGLGFAIDEARRLAIAEGLPDARITSDVKHVEVGLTDKGDSMAWVLRDLAPALGLPSEAVLVAGDEFGGLAGFPGSDSQMRIPEARHVTFVSVGSEPNGVPEGVHHLKGGPARFKTLLAEQATIRLATLPAIFIPSLDPAWNLSETGFLPPSEHEVESRFALSNGYSGTRGSLMEDGPSSRSGCFLAGIFDPGRAGFPELVIAPFWPALRIEVAGEPLNLDVGELLLHRRTLDLRRGMLLRSWRHRSPEGRITRVHEARWASLSDRHALFQHVWIVPENYSAPLRFTGILDGTIRDFEGEVHLLPVSADGSPLLLLSTRQSAVKLAFAGAAETDPSAVPEALIQGATVETRWRLDGRMAEPLTLRRGFAAYTERDDPDPARSARAHADRLLPLNLEGFADAHEAAWASRWEDADIRISGDAEAQHALRFATYHLIGAADPGDYRVSVGARALTGEGYKGHVFWDTEIYMLPFYLHTHPPSAKALLMYRYHTLDAARRRANAMGYRGALYAWESTDTGEETAPESVIGFDGERVPILTGKLAHHVSSAVVHGVWKYWQATGDDAFMAETGAEIVLEVARFWASRIARDAEGCGHIRHVVGPDEYHEDVDDNAYTNGMARFCLELGNRVAAWLRAERPEAWDALAQRIGLSPSVQEAGLEGRDVRETEPEAWLHEAQCLVTGFDPERGIHEQFAGYFQLEDLDMTRYADRTIPMDVLLGRSIRETQVIKQADVVMLLFLLWERFPPETRRADFRYYEPRSGHGSSLSPGVHALVAAKLGDFSMALHYFRFASAIDLSNRMGNASEGLHMAALGCLWQVVVFGFAGMHVREDGLALDPNLPAEWQSLEFAFHYRGQRLGISLTPTDLEIDCSVPVPIHLGEGAIRELSPGRHRARFEGGTWTWMVAPSP